MKQFYVYIVTNHKHGTLYVGMTSNIAKRAWEHKEKVVDGFTKRYDLKRLVYAESHATAEGAIHREKRLKNWKRQWKIELIEGQNPDWRDLYDDLV
jgi:Predicted endonuclease containing a URI domain